MFKTFKIALFSLLMAGQAVAEDTYQFQELGNVEQFSWGHFSAKDVLLSGPSSVEIRSFQNLSISGKELYSILVDKGNYISVTDFSSESEVAFLRVTIDTLPPGSNHFF